MYQVILEDEWNNLECLGFFKKLDDIVPIINNGLLKDSKYKLKEGDISEYTSTFGPCFDYRIGEVVNADENNDDYDWITSQYIRGFIFDDNKLANEVGNTTADAIKHIEHDLAEVFYTLELHRLKDIKMDTLYWIGKRDALFREYEYILNLKVGDAFNATTYIDEDAKKRAKADFEKKEEPILIDEFKSTTIQYNGFETYGI